MKLNADFDYVWTAPRLVWRGADGIRVEQDEAPGASTAPAVGRCELPATVIERHPVKPRKRRVTHG